jgi:anti-anti-sigma factor
MTVSAVRSSVCAVHPAPAPPRPITVSMNRAGEAASVETVRVASVTGRRSGHAVRLACHWLTPPVVVISARGEIDAANADNLTEFAVANVMRCHRLILDLRGLDFIGADGFSALLRISVSCAGAGTEWAMVTSAAVSRLLQVCDPHGELPVADSTAAAVAMLHGHPYTDCG